jgi:hypothetical protein
VTETEELLERLRLERQLAEYWHDVDANWGRNAGSYYTEDAVFDGGEAVYRGRAKIEEFYAWRVKRGPRTAVHAFTNYRATFRSDREALATWYLLLYAADGVPVLPTHPPINIALVTDELVKRDGSWLVRSRKFQALFMGGTPPTNPKLDEE